jgi:hypothetical protein
MRWGCYHRYQGSARRPRPALVMAFSLSPFSVFQPAVKQVAKKARVAITSRAWQ